MTRFQEITERWQREMEDTQQRHMRRVAEIKREQFWMTVAIVFAGAFAIFGPFIFLR